MTTTILIVIHLIVVLALVAVVLLQRSEGGALGIGGGGGGGGFFSSRGTANLLTRTTGILAAIFFVTSLTLGILAGTNAGPSSIFQQDLQGGGPAGIPNNTRGDGQGILDTLRGGPAGGEATPGTPAGEPAPPAAPTAPAGPQVPNN